jgi:hypothetical protein
VSHGVTRVTAYFGEFGLRGKFLSLCISKGIKSTPFGNTNNNILCVAKAADSDQPIFGARSASPNIPPRERGDFNPSRLTPQRSERARRIGKAKYVVYIASCGGSWVLCARDGL